MVVKAAKLVFKLHEQRDKLAPSIEYRRRYLQNMFNAQVRAEKESILSHINKLQPGLRRAFLRDRLEQLNRMGGR